MLIISILLCVPFVWADQGGHIADDFERTYDYNKAATFDTSVWTNGRNAGRWGIVDGEAAATPSRGETVVYNKALSTMSGNGYEFTLSVEVRQLVANRYAGVVFNYQNESNYYTFRYKSGSGSYQVRRMVNGVDSSVSNVTAPDLFFGTNIAYILTVTSSEAYKFSVSIADVADPKTLLVNNVVMTDANNSFTGGYGGLNQVSPYNTSRFDNFRLDVVSKQETLAGRSDVVLESVSVPEVMTNAGMTVVLSASKNKSLVNSIGMEFVCIEPGSFVMGQDGPAADYRMDRHPEKFDDADWDERPAHKVTVTTDFYMGATEVTLGQYRQFKPEFIRHEGATDEAVRFVSWYDAVAFCEWLSVKEGKSYRLPTEAEWEYACRAGTTTLFNTGDTLPPGSHAWFGNDSYRTYFFKDVAMPLEYSWTDGSPVLRVAQTLPNAWGLFNMHGNVSEWCSDWYGPYENVSQIDPQGRSDGDFRVIRGGSHSVFTRQLRSANRTAWLPESFGDKTGFRVVLGELPSGQILPRIPSPEAVVNQKAVVIEEARADAPFFSGPKPFVIIPPRSLGPLFSFHNHSPSITECPNGDLLAIWFSCVLEQGIELCNVSSRLRYGSSEWEPAMPFWDGVDINDHAPKIWWDGDRTIFNFAVGRDGDIMRTSSDNGETWSKARFITVRSQEFGNRLLQLRDGTLVLGSDNRLVSLVYSRDGGETWEHNDVQRRESDFRPGGNGYRYPGIHAAMVELADGRIMAVSRNDKLEDQALFGGKTPVSYTGDLGKTWTYEATEFPAIGSTQRAAMIRLRGGQILLCSFTDLRSNWGDPNGMSFKAADGATFTGYGLFAAVSYDDGKTWPVRKLITPGGADQVVNGTDSIMFTLGDTKAEQNGYLDAIQTRDGNIQLITSRNHYVFNLVWLETLPELQNK
ncbi:MAG: SUMF1/EgtB/PvdO family nonheme iron enzyme [Kiritimatiellales bacterium]